MRNPPEFSAPGLHKNGAADQISMTRRYQLITPLFGGGVQAGQVDLTTPVRGSTIRGQLRFWWRATRGGEFDGDLARMKDAEEALWGSTSRASRVIISANTTDIGTVFQVPYKDRDGRPRSIGDPGSIYGYAGFPLRQDNGTVRENVAFDLSLSFPADAAFDVRAALWAWETFGGVGARTRRGFGAPACAPGDFSAEWLWQAPSHIARAKLLEQVSEFVSDGPFPPGVPHLSRSSARYVVRITRDNTPLTAWEDLLSALKAFRQNRAGNRGFGRSKWPEPDALRDITGQDGSQFNHHVPMHGRLIKKFPRAAFGLPIVFEFHPRQSHPSNPRYDPRRTTLVGVNATRLASPLIIRPLQCRDRAVGLAVVLEGPRLSDLGGLALKEGSEKGPVIAAPLSENLSSAEAALVQAKHDFYDADPDVLQSFLNIL